MGPLDVPTFKKILKERCIVLTGGIATGKSTIANLLKSKSFICFDADKFARIVVLPGKPALERLKSVLGPSILNDDGTLNRATLRSIMFSDSDTRKKIESILHPAIANEFKDAVERSGVLQSTKVFFYEAPLIHEQGRGDEFLASWCTTCSDETQMRRLLSRESGPKTQVEANAIVQAQMPQVEKVRRSTHALNTEESLSSLEQQINWLLKSLPA